MGSFAFRIALLIGLAGPWMVAASTARAADAARSAPPLPIDAPVASRTVEHAAVPDSASEEPAVDAHVPPAAERAIRLHLSAGLALISVPLQTSTRTLSGLLPGLPAGARAWTWSASAQQWVEGFDQELALGEGALLHLPEPAVLTFVGRPAPSSRIPVELANGWNLVGVPQPAPLPLGTQSIWAGGIERPFDDAVARKMVGERVFALDATGNGHRRVRGMLEPGQAYWVHANDAELLTLQPALLKGAAQELAWWTAKQAGAAGFSYLSGQLIASISPDPNQPILDKLDAMARQIEDVQRTQQRVLDQFTLTRTQIRMTEAQILSAVGEVNLKNVRSSVAAHFDDASNQNGSLMYFASQAQTAEGRARITRDNKLEFARNVLKTWDFVTQLNAVHEAIAPADGSRGVLDYFAEKIVLGGADDSTIEDRYLAMEAYFNGLVGLQVKIMSLLTNAWSTLAEEPGSGYSAALADQWRATTYSRNLATQALRFRDASERIMAGSLRVAAEITDAPVSFPADVANLIVPRVDFGVMQLANEAPGVRVRVFLGQHMNEPNTFTIVDAAGRTLLGLPSADSGLWITLPGSPTQVYDAWRVRGNPAKFDSKSAVWEFHRADSWIMYRATLPALAPGTYGARLVDAWNVTDDDVTPRLYGLQTFEVGTVDEQKRPARPGTLFGSLVLAKRAAARTALRVYNDGASSYWDYCRPAGVARPGKEHDYFVIGGNCYGGGWAGYQRLLPFFFAGPQASAAGDWQMAMTTKVGGGCPVREDICASNYSLGQIELLDNGASFSKIVRFDSATQASYHAPLRWDRNHAYQLNFRVVHTGTSNGVPTEAWRGGLVIRFNPTP